MVFLWFSYGLPEGNIWDGLKAMVQCHQICVKVGVRVPLETRLAEKSELDVTTWIYLLGIKHGAKNGNIGENPTVNGVLICYNMFLMGHFQQAMFDYYKGYVQYILADRSKRECLMDFAQTRFLIVRASRIYIYANMIRLTITITISHISITWWNHIVWNSHLMGKIPQTKSRVPTITGRTYRPSICLVFLMFFSILFGACVPSVI